VSEQSGQGEAGTDSYKEWVKVCLLRRGAEGELRPIEIQSDIDDHYSDLPKPERRALAIRLVGELLREGLIVAVDNVPDPDWREKQDRWEKANDYGPGPGAPAMTVFAPWDVDPQLAASRIAAEWPSDPSELDQVPSWEFVLTESGTKLIKEEQILE
jgi:hypothetical protein